MATLGKHLGKLIPHRPGGIAYICAVLFPQVLSVMDNTHLKIYMLLQEFSTFAVEIMAVSDIIR